MGWFDGGSTLSERAPGASSSHRSHSRDKHHRSSSKHRSTASIFGGDDHKHHKSPTASAFGGDSHKHHKSSSASIFGGGDHHKHNSSRTSLFGGLGGGDHNKHSSSRSIFGGDYSKKNSSRSSFFGGFGGGRSTSRYSRSPRGGFVKRAYSKLRRLLRDLVYYMKRNPMKVFMLVIMPLITGGALTGLMRKFGIRMPAGIQRMMGGSGAGQNRNGGMQYERTSVRGEGPLGSIGAMGAMGGVSNVMGAMGGIGSAMKMAKMFM